MTEPRPVVGEKPRPLRLSDLPVASHNVARATRGLSRWVATLGTKAIVPVRGLGDLTTSVVAFASADARAASTDVSFTLRTPSVVALRLDLDGLFAHAVIARLLGTPAPSIARPLTSLERGVLAAVVATVLRAAPAAVSLALDAPAPLDENAVAVVLAITVAGENGVARVICPLDAARRAPSAAVDAALAHERGLRVSAHVTLARTLVTAGGLAALAPGDAVVFSGLTSLPDGDIHDVDLVIGARAARARLSSDGDLRIIGDFIASDPMSAATTTKVVGGDVLAAAPVELVAEVARVSLRGDEVVGLIEGAVLALGKAALDNVTLVAAGQPVARGVLVDIDGELGVRITERLR